MIYRIERRTVSGNGTAESHYELIKYERKTPIGVLVGGKTILKKKKKSDVQKYCSIKGISIANDTEQAGKQEKCVNCLCAKCEENSTFNDNRVCDGCTYCNENNLKPITVKQDCALNLN